MSIDKHIDVVERKFKRLESPLERVIFGSRWPMSLDIAFVEQFMRQIMSKH